jgi:hypothetical protein|tara:strand:- start:1481 stop:1633 length:153 start_codon:yes stop_codon:yes gene_type:complete
VEDVEKTKISLEQVELERDLWEAALRCPPPYPSKKKYNRKKNKNGYEGSD